eukprot:scaffold7052_cov254-Pinguiococcus_pyrenoidosus.AAC.92
MQIRSRWRRELVQNLHKLFSVLAVVQDRRAVCRPQSQLWPSGFARRGNSPIRGSTCTAKAFGRCGRLCATATRGVIRVYDRREIPKRREEEHLAVDSPDPERVGHDVHGIHPLDGRDAPEADRKLGIPPANKAQVLRGQEKATLHGKAAPVERADERLDHRLLLRKVEERIHVDSINSRNHAGPDGLEENTLRPFRKLLGFEWRLHGLQGFLDLDHRLRMILYECHRGPFDHLQVGFACSRGWPSAHTGCRRRCGELGRSILAFFKGGKT